MKAKNKKNLKNKQDRDPFASREAEKYADPIASREYILQFISDCKCPPSFEQLVEKFHIADSDQKRALDRRLSAMMRDGQLNCVNNRYQLILEQDLVEGVVLGHQDGYGFLHIGKGQPDLYIANYEMAKVFSGDIVKALPQVSGRGTGKIEAKIVSIVERKIKQLVGKVKDNDGELLLIPDDNSIKNTIRLNKFNAKLKDNQIIIAEIIHYPSKNEPATARVIEIIGDYHAPGIEIETALRRFKIPSGWPDKVLSEVEHFGRDVTEQDSAGRLDLRNVPLVTIDGEDAKDFDDAVYCERTAYDGFRLIVAIADVSSYVKPNSHLDEEAYLRGTSVYFPGKVIPMLPEILSNGLCSLNPHVDRLCFVCEALLDSDGNIQKYRFLPAVMRSRARLTYTKVAEILLNDNKQLIKEYAELVPHLQNLYALFKTLNKHRGERGAIDFDSTETMIEFDDNLKIAAIHPVVRNDAHRLIEECMLIANVSAAHFCLKNKIPVLYRNHEPPPLDRQEKLQDFLKPLGLALKKMPPHPKDLSKLLEKTHNRPDKHVIQMVVLRSLSQAMYEPENKGHFGLAYDQYAHFTSPIRRYPDLLLHRQLHHYLAKTKKWQQVADKNLLELDKPTRAYFSKSKQNLVAMGEHCSFTERRADEATRDVTSWLKCEYMQDKVGMDFTGCVSSVTGFGLFVELDEVYVEGLVHVTDLPGDYYKFDERMHLLRGEHTNKIYRIGDAIKIKVARVDLSDRHIDFVLADVDYSKSENRVKPKAKFQVGKNREKLSPKKETSSKKNKRKKDKQKKRSRKKKR